MGARECLYREMSGLVVGCWAEPGMERGDTGRADGPADYACGGMSEPGGLSLSAPQ